MNNPIAPAQLFCGSRLIVEQETIFYLQKQFCTQQGCKNCTVCLQILEKRHYATVWIEPEKRYTLDDISPIFKRINFILDKDQLCFFLLTGADFLSVACANSLLKLVEEPPKGYHFIFLAERAAQVIPTIRSRCTQTTFSRKQSTSELPLLVQHFMKINSDPLSFLKELATCTMTEQECMVYVDELLNYWITVYKRATQSSSKTQQENALAVVIILKEQLKNPPAPGSTKIFWKNLFLQKESIAAR